MIFYSYAILQGVFENVTWTEIKVNFSVTGICYQHNKEIILLPGAQSILKSLSNFNC